MTRLPPSLRFLSISTVLTGLGLLAGACSSSSSSGASDFVGQYCDLEMPCCAKAGLSTNGSQCRAFLGAFTNSSSYDAAKGDACLKEMRAAQSNPDFCTGSSSLAPSCNGVFATSGGGTKKPGEACDTDSNCATSSQGKVRCASSYDSKGARTSVCQLQIPGKEGDAPCGGTIDGNSTYFSGSSSSGAPPAQIFTCDVKDGIYCKSSFATDAPPASCTRIAAIGAACEGSSSSYACVKGAYCDFVTSTCKAKASVGQPCSGSDTCADGAYCDTSSGSSSTCLAQLAEGADCTSSSQCISDTCNNKKCAKGSTGDLGLAFICGA